jgi:hypothetical protein
MASVSIKGVALAWGTGSMLGTPLNSYVCESMTLTPTIELIKLEAGSGVNAARTCIKKGFEATVQVPMVVGGTLPDIDAAGGVTVTLPSAEYYDDPLTGGKVAFACHVTDKSVSTSKKREQQVTIKLEYDPDIAP